MNKQEVILYMEGGGVFEFPTSDELTVYQNLGQEIRNWVEGLSSEASRQDIENFLEGMRRAKSGDLDFT